MAEKQLRITSWQKPKVDDSEFAFCMIKLLFGLRVSVDCDVLGLSSCRGHGQLRPIREFNKALSLYQVPL